MVGLLIEARLLKCMEVDEEYDYDHILINDSTAQGFDKENCSVGEDNPNMQPYMSQFLEMTLDNCCI